MPPKPLRMRTWGTRFDTLPTSPPVSPPTPETTNPDAVSVNAPEAPATEPVLKGKEEKMPHDASVFVGSLPANIDHQELTRLLSVHLSEHTEVKNIKVVRDSKGGVCAFVQCEVRRSPQRYSFLPTLLYIQDAASAASLINTLHSSTPKQFLGRTLRYEPARAFRTLLISYRTPMQHIPAHGLEGNSKIVELNLPTAMRAWRPRNSKFYSLLYNSEAVDAGNYACNDLNVVSDKPSLFLQPVAFDAETINTIAAYFGPLESFSDLQLAKNTAEPTSDNVNEDWKLYPSPHDAPRSTKMETGCWEIKWEHRDDCVSALMTLRRVPHLTVTWAHQPPPLGFEQRSPYMPFPQNSFAQYPFHVQDQMRHARSRAVSLSDPFGFSRRLIKTRGSSHSASENGDSDDENDVAYPEDTSGDASIRWSDMDFPPLGDTKRSLKSGSGVWSERQQESGRSRSASLSFSQRNTESFSTSGSRPEDDSEIKELGQELDMPATPGLGRSPLTPKTPGFPTTPTTACGAMQKLSLKEGSGGKGQHYYNDLVSRERDIDPTTLFVGGLETFGPGAWDEEKVTKFFARFGGLEEVKIVRPLNSHAAFAFVKFNNTEAPARAVFEEVGDVNQWWYLGLISIQHNRIYEGRAMRVQLRDCNPQRGSWKQNRGRGHFHQQKFGPHRHIQDEYDTLPDNANSRSNRRQDAQNQVPKPSHDTSSAVAEPAEADPPVYTETVAPKAKEEPAESDDAAAPVSSNEAPTSSPSPPFTSLSAPASENYREWYDEPLPASPAPPSSFNSSVSVPAATPALPYSVPGGYYAAPWMQPYGQPMQFPMPYVGFPGYAVPGQPPMPPNFQRPPGTDGSGTPAPGTWPHMGIYGSYIPYQTPPTRTPTAEPTPSQQHLNTRAPLAPTGFIQNEQGTLIAVYQPEALDQYMSGGQVAPPALPQQSVASIPSWAPYNPPTAYPPAGPPSAVTMPLRQTPSTTNITWIPNQGFVPQQQPHSTPNLAGTWRGGFSDGGGQANGAPFRRHPGRRDHGGPQNNQARNNQPRSFQNRNGRGNVPPNAGPYHGHGDATATSRNNHLNTNEWNQWGAAGPR
ncbi:hypothetical protein H0H87_004530 [Tephrocybe sp. NHM501043]|nr:hypothetical protein H0H87_004530 [Tephrocybe sp. NHM501043]